jgi:hypothetical protein
VQASVGTARTSVRATCLMAITRSSDEPAHPLGCCHLCPAVRPTPIIL